MWETPPTLQNHSPRSSAADRVIGGGEQHFRVRRLNEQQLCRIATKFCDARRIDMAGAIRGIGGAQPDERATAGGAQREQRGESGCARAAEYIGGEKFMDTPGRQAAAKRGIEIRMTARQPISGLAARCATIGSQPGDALAQPGERGRRLAHHLFLICSISARAGTYVKMSRAQGQAGSGGGGPRAAVAAQGAKEGNTGLNEQ